MAGSGARSYVRDARLRSKITKVCCHPLLTSVASRSASAVSAVSSQCHRCIRFVHLNEAPPHDVLIKFAAFAQFGLEVVVILAIQHVRLHPRHRLGQHVVRREEDSLTARMLGRHGVRVRALLHGPQHGDAMLLLGGNEAVIAVIDDPAHSSVPNALPGSAAQAGSIACLILPEPLLILLLPLASGRLVGNI